MKVLYISGSPRKNSNTDYLLKETLSVTGGEFLKITDYHIEPGRSCWTCLKSGKCALDADAPEATESARKLGARLIEIGALLGLQSKQQRLTILYILQVDGAQILSTATC